MATLFKCISCETLWEEIDTVTLFECGSCGSVFSRDNSADGLSNRCPDCQKFAGTLTNSGCPDCEEETEEVDAEYDEEAGEMREVVPPEPVVAPLHYHWRITRVGGQVEISARPYDTLEEARLFWEQPWPEVTDNKDGTFSVYKRDSHHLEQAVDFIECTEKHKKQRR